MVAESKSDARSRTPALLGSIAVACALVSFAPAGQAGAVLDCGGVMEEPCAILGSVGFGDICAIDALSQFTGQPASCPGEGVLVGARIGLEYYRSTVWDTAGVSAEGTIDVLVHVAHDDSTTYRLVTPTAKAEEVSPDVWTVHFPASKNHGYFMLEVLEMETGATPSYGFNILPDDQAEPEYVPNLLNSHTAVLIG